jgi:hypothetical protein
MKIDIKAIDVSKGINNKNAVASTMVTGYSSILSLRPNYPLNLTIENIESKYAERFDNITYYTIGNTTIST